jgi:hypothetical protein
MDSWDTLYYSLQNDLKHKADTEKRFHQVSESVDALTQEEQIALDAKKVLASVADERADQVLGFITSVVNKALADIFVGKTRRIELKRSLYRGKIPHINLVLHTEHGEQSMKHQSGNGLQQIIAFIYRLCLIEVRGLRKIVFMDENLSGVHSVAMEDMKTIIELFRDGGFQFFIIEYRIPEQFGKVVEVVPNSQGFSELVVRHDQNSGIAEDSDVSSPDSGKIVSKDAQESLNNLDAVASNDKLFASL